MSNPKRTRRKVAAKVAPRRPWWRRLLRMLAAVLVVAMVGSALAVLSLRWINPPTSGIAIYRMLQAKGGSQSERQTWHCWQPIESINTSLLMAVIASEDQRFAEHHGFDLVEVGKALAQAKDGGRLRGASTLSQQTAKNLFLWPGRSWFRKGMEVWFTGLIELTWPKRRILEMYLNIVEFGDGIYGACAASRRHFGVEASALSPIQAARLAATLPNPHIYHANPPSPAVQARAAWILEQIRNLDPEAYLRSLDIATAPTPEGQANR